MKHIFSPLVIFTVILLGFLHCSDPINNTVPQPDRLNNETTILKVIIPASSITKTRMSEQNTYQIDPSTFRIFIFNDNAFQDIATIKGTPVLHSGEGPEGVEDFFYEVALENIPVVGDNKASLVFFANADVTTPEEGATKEQLYESARFQIEGKWDVNTPRLIPLWGEINNVTLNDVFGTKYDTQERSVRLLRATARIDIIVSDADNEGSAVQRRKVDLKEVFVYRTLHDGFLAPMKSNFDAANTVVTAPSVPSDAKFNKEGGAAEDITDATENPVKYTVPETEQHSFLRHIFVTEQVVAANPNEKMCLVIAADYSPGNTSYYRIDFVPLKRGDEPITYNILRNHIYLINIRGAIGPGYQTKEEALAAGSSNIDVDVVVWDEGINNGFISGENYFGIKINDILFESHEKDQINETTKFQTNIPLDLIESTIEYSWKTGNIFNCEIDIESNIFRIKTLNDNTSGNILTDILTIKIYGKEYKIMVTQNPVKPNYRLICERSTVHGIFIVGTPLDSSKHFIRVFAESDENLSGKLYSISSREVDGISFSAEGEFEMTLQPNGKWGQEIQLSGEGTASSSLPKTMIVTPNSLNYHVCEVVVKMAYTPKKILGTSNGTNFGYATDKTTNNSPYSWITRTSERCFGLNENSVIKIPQLGDAETQAEWISRENHNAAYLHITQAQTNNSALLTQLLTVADIFIIGYSTTLSDGSGKIVSDFIKRGGVVIFFNENAASGTNLLKNFYQGINVDAHNTFNAAGSRYSFATQIGDMVADGPFGSTNGKIWGEDASNTFSVRGIPEEDVVVYSNSVRNGREALEQDKGVVIFRHTKYNLFYIGDGGFISQSGDATAFISNTICPYMCVTEGEDRGLPLPKIDYGNPTTGGVGPVYNSLFFCNVLAWAIDRAEFHGQHSQ